MINIHPFPISLLFLCFLKIFTAAVHNNVADHFTITGDVSINCGSSGTSAARNGRAWQGDVYAKTSSLVQIKGTSTTSTLNHVSADPVPYKTARISRSQFSYQFFKLNPGPKIIRLHFNPATYKGFKRFDDFFTIESGPFTLLSNFSASLTADALGVDSFTKEFCINLQENQELNIIFSPENSQSYAFVNGIEILSVPAGLSYFNKGDVNGGALQVVGEKSLVQVDNSTALEIVHRQNNKQDSVSSSADDTSDIFGMWETVNNRKSNNITWKISVDVGFRYLVRLHFSKLGFKMAETAGLVFKIYINEMIANTHNIGTVRERDDDNSNPLFRDYIVMMKGRKQEGKHNLLICLQANDEFMDGYGPLKGFEIMKLSNLENSLAGPNPLPLKHDSSHRTIHNLLRVLGRREVPTILITILALLNIVIHTLVQIQEASCTEEENKPSARAERLCRRFRLAELQLATRDFSDAHFIGRGGFGKVYKGQIDNGQETMVVAIKRLKSSSKQGAHEFLTEIETLTELRHVNLVSLIGYCNEHGEMILVYEYMAGGTLADHLYKLARNNSNISSLTWKQRLNICIGAGRGLDYLHTGHSIIHRDVKASNILLDENFTAKFSDFGLAKHENRSKLQSHVTTNVKGTFGYFDPYYVTTRKLTRKSDTYAFGVVLLEVLCGRPALDTRVAEDERSLTKWARDNISKGKTDQIVASNLRGEISEESLRAFVGVAERCLHDEPKKRPTMAQVVLQLEFALEQQESIRPPVPNRVTSDVDDNIHPSTDEETNLSVGTGELTMPFKDVQNLAPAPNEQSKSKVVDVEPSGRKDKPSRLWPWNTFWNRVKISTINEWLLSGTNINANTLLIKGRRRKTGLKIFSPIIKKTEDLAFLIKEDGLASLNIIGRGGCGEVYKGVLPGSNGKEIAIKKIIQISSRDDEKLTEEDSKLLNRKMRHIQSEIKTAGQIRHRNLLPLLAHLRRPDCHYLVYEYMKNGSLQDYLQQVTEGKRELDWLARCKIALGIASGLEYLHMSITPRIIHRDLKPANVLLDDEMEAQITDFGLAKAVPDAETHVTTSNVAGTLGYIAPEYHQTFKFSEKCDIYSFGVVLGVLVMGKLPSDEFFQNTDEISLVKWMRNVMTSEDPKRAIDPRLLGNGYEEQMLLVLKVACFCTLENAKERPNSKDARCMLSQIMVSQNADISARMAAFERDRSLIGRDCRSDSNTSWVADASDDLPMQWIKF